MPRFCRDGTGWDGMGWDGIAWDGIAWDGMACRGVVVGAPAPAPYLARVQYCNATVARPPLDKAPPGDVLYGAIPKATVPRADTGHTGTVHSAQYCRTVQYCTLRYSTVPYTCTVRRRLGGSASGAKAKKGTTLERESPTDRPTDASRNSVGHLPYRAGGRGGRRTAVPRHAAPRPRRLGAHTPALVGVDVTIRHDATGGDGTGRDGTGRVGSGRVGRRVYV